MTLADTASGTMYFEQFYLGCLAHASYLLGSEGEAVVVDPQRDVEIYLKAAQEHGLKIHIFETHLHADFVSGHKELAARSGATIYIGAQAGATFPHVDLTDGFELRFGRAGIKVLETPGHTPESICLLVTDEQKSSQPWAVLTGDTLFIGDVGRPDLQRRILRHSWPGSCTTACITNCSNLQTRLRCIRLMARGRCAGARCARSAPRQSGRNA